MSKPSIRCEHVVVITIKTPTHISNEERLLYQKLYEISNNRSAQKSVKEQIKGVFK